MHFLLDKINKFKRLYNIHLWILDNYHNSNQHASCIVSEYEGLRLPLNCKYMFNNKLLNNFIKYLKDINSIELYGSNLSYKFSKFLKKSLYVEINITSLYYSEEQWLKYLKNLVELDFEGTYHRPSEKYMKNLKCVYDMKFEKYDDLKYCKGVEEFHLTMNVSWIHAVEKENNFLKEHISDFSNLKHFGIQ